MEDSEVKHTQSVLAFKMYILIKCRTTGYSLFRKQKSRVIMNLKKL